MCALHRTATNIQWRADNLIHSQSFGSDGRTHNIDYGIDGTDFMEMHALDGRIVNLRFRRVERLKDHDRSLLRAVGNFSAGDNLPNLRQPSPMRMLVGV